ncbi:hypothetical protein D3C81_318000 [compost metagenome]
MKKLLIGLVGGRPGMRAEISDTLVQDGHAQLAAWGDHDGYGEHTRDMRLAGVLEGVGQLPGGGLIVTNVDSDREAQRIRRAGGQLWHIMGGQPHGFVAILPGEPLVSLCRDPQRPHWRTPLQALSELQLSRRRLPKTIGA